MSRYYEITVTPRIPNAGASTPWVWTSFPGGVNDPGALNVEFDFFSSTTYQGGQAPVGTLTIEGIALPDLFQTQQFYDAGIIVKAGMQKGLPLAQPSQAGTIWNGTVNQAFGNWVGTEMTLDFVMYPSVNYTLQKPGNFVFNWQPGTSLQSALTTCFATAYPGLASPKFAIGSQYVPPGNGGVHAVSTFPLLCQYVNSITKSITPPGVFMAINPDNSIHVWDGTKNAVQATVAFTDLIGQPTWIGANLMQFMTVMRADIQAGDVVTLPQGIGAAGSVSTTAAAFPSQLGPQYKTAFQGNFSIQSVRYIGNFRDPNGQSWATVFKAVPI